MSGKGLSSKLFGGMKIKGQTTKIQQKQKQKETIINQNKDIKKSNQSINNNIKDSQNSSIKSKQSNSNKNQEYKPNLTHIQSDNHDNQNIEQYNSNLDMARKSKTTIQQIIQQEQPKKMHKKQSIKQSQNEKAVDLRKKDYQSHQQIIEQVKGQMKQIKKSRSQKDYKEQEQSDQENEIKQDRSEIVGNKKNQNQIQDQQIEFKKQTKNSVSVMIPKIAETTSQKPKTNAFLAHLKKPTPSINKPNKVTSSSPHIKQTSNLNMQQKSLQSATAFTEKTKKQKQVIMQQLNALHSRILENVLAKKQLKQQLMTLNNTIFQLNQTLSTLTHQQNLKIAQEQYQQADHLQSEIQSYQSQISQHEIQLSYIQEQYYKLQFKSVDIYKQYYEDSQRMIRKIKLLEMEIEESVLNYGRNEDQKIENQKIVNENERKKISRIVNDIASQYQQLEKYQKTFYDDLNARRKPLEVSLNQEQTKKKSLQLQIKQLQEQLKRKKIALKSTNLTIQSINQKISQVDRTFEEEKVKLNERKEHLSDLEMEKQEHQGRLEKMQAYVKELEDNKIKEIEKILKQKEMLQKLNKKIENNVMSSKNKSNKQTLQSIQTILLQKKSKISSFIQHSKSLQAFQNEHKSKRQAIAQLEFKKSNILSQVNKKQQLTKQLKNKIPKLQNEQKQLSLNKNFKGAAMKKNELKECQDELGVIKKQIEELYIQEGELDQQINKIKQEQEKYKDEQTEIRRQLAFSQYNLAKEKQREIIQEKLWLNELGNQKMKEKYVKVLDEELDCLREEISYIKQEYGINEEQNNEIEEEKVLEKENQKEQFLLKVDQGKNEMPVDNRPQNEQKSPELQSQQNQQEKQPKLQQQFNPPELNIDGEVNQEKSQPSQHEPQLQHQHQKQQQGEQQQEQGYVPLQLD